VLRLLVRVSVGSVRVWGSSTTRTRVAGTGAQGLLAGRGVLSWCWARPDSRSGVLADGCWTVGSRPTGVRTDQSTSAHHAGRDARSRRDDIEEDTRTTRDLNHREGPGMRTTNLQTAQVIDADRRVLGTLDPGRVQQKMHLHMREHWWESSA
jgi:hypothetical protein